MFRWIKDNFGLRNLLILSLVILVIVGFVKGPSWYKQIMGSTYDGVAEATVTNIVAKDASYQHLNGTNTKIVGYTISYDYEVKGKDFSNTEFVEPSSDIKEIYDQFNAGKTCTIEIKYSDKTPSESVISKLNLNK